MSNYTEAGRPPDVADSGSTPRSKGLAKGRLGLLASVVLGISTIAPVYTLTGVIYILIAVPATWLSVYAEHRLARGYA